ncbi:putative dnaJ -like subfamily C member 30 [Scophthalmus maximus]|nr:putative dnaJ -like subfamily C member 30 [Scophthalmus maximus]
MAEVGQRLVCGAYRLSALRTSQSRVVFPGDSPGCLLVNVTVGESRVEEESCRDPREEQPVTESRVAQGRSRESRRSKCQQENGSVPRATSLELDSLRFVGFDRTKASLQAYETALQHAARLQPLLRDKLLLPCRMTSWSRGAVDIHRDVFRSHQQLRALCVFILAKQESERPGCGRRLRRLNLHPDPSAATRNYSWRSDRSSKEPLLHRSRTAYYDVLKVPPGATQSQIKTAYYKQSFINHPDKNPGDKEASQKFTEISEAYTVLGNISLRKKYDRGLLNQLDVQSAGRPSSKDAKSSPTASPQQRHQDRARRFSQASGKTMFDFDAFYQAHYGEQLQREREMRARKERMKEKQKEYKSRWTEGRMMEMTLVMMIALAGVIILDIRRP